MAKQFKHTDLSDVLCSNPKCAEVNGRKDGARRKIKENVVSRAGHTSGLECYPCSRKRRGK